MKIKAVFFDMDGLMFDTERLSSAIWVQHAPLFGVPLVEKDLQLLRGRNAADGKAAFLAHFGADAPFDAICAATRAQTEAQLETHIPILPGLVELLAFLKSEDIPMAVVSSTRRETVLHHLELAGVRDYFCEVLGGDMVEHSKPAPDIYLKAAALLGVAPENGLVLEDSYNGVRAGHAAGCYTVMVPDMDPATDEMKALADEIVQSLHDVIPLVQRKNGLQ